LRIVVDLLDRSHGLLAEATGWVVALDNTDDDFLGDA
jgi:hypothetical protein